MMRRVRCFVWVDAADCDAPHGLDMAGKRDADKVLNLVDAFEKNGFDVNEPALVGYVLNGRIQLLSGTHRHLAAQIAGIKLPVTLWLSGDVMETWGTELWEETIRDIPVRELQSFAMKDGPNRSPYDAIDLSGGWPE